MLSAGPLPVTSLLSAQTRRNLLCLHPASSASCLVISLYSFVAGLFKVLYVPTLPTSSLPIPIPQPPSPAASPKLVFCQVRDAPPPPGLIQPAHLGPGLLALLGRTWLLFASSIHFLSLASRAERCWLPPAELLPQSPFVHSFFSSPLPFHAQGLSPLVLFSLSAFYATCVPTAPKCKSPAQSFCPYFMHTAYSMPPPESRACPWLNPDPPPAGLSRLL